MGIPTKDEAHRILRPYHGVILRVIHESWGEWWEVQSFRSNNGWPPMLYHRSIANYVFDTIARRAIPAFGSEPRVTVKAERQTFKLFVGGLLARMKKGDEDNLGVSSPTQTALAFEVADGVLPGLPPETAKVEIIWRPNDIWTKIDRVLVVARDGDKLIWEYEIDDAGEGADIIPFPLSGSPAPSQPVEPDVDDGLIKPKARPAAKPNE